MTKFCPDCGAKAEGARFCPECGHALAGGAGENNVMQRSSVETRGPIDDSVISRSTVNTDRASIKDAVISHSTITQTETHQHFGETVGTYDTQMELGRTAYEGRNYEEAVDFFNAALKIDSRGFEPWFLKGLACAELRRTDEAITNLRRALRSADGHRPRAVGELRGLIERTAKGAQVLEAQATQLLSKANIELQYSYQYKAGAKTEKGRGMMGALALDLLVLPGLGSSMRTTSAVEGIEKKQEADKREAEGRKLEEQAREILSGAVRQYNSAIRYCDLIIEFDKQDEFSWFKRGEIFMRLKLYQDACKSYEALLAFSPCNQEAIRLRGMCYTAQGLTIPAPTGVPAAGGPLQKPQPEPRKQPPAPAPAPPPPAIPPPEPLAPMQAAPPPVRTHQQLPPSPQPQMAPSRIPPAQYPQRQPAPPQMVAPQARPQARPNISQAPPSYPGGYPPQQTHSQCVPQMRGQPQAIRMAPCANPCPYCRGEMAFVMERNAWFCGSCRRFCDRPAR